MAIIQESSFVCNNFYLNTAFGNQTYAYEFQVPPAFHGFDVVSKFNDLFLFGWELWCCGD